VLQIPNYTFSKIASKSKPMVALDGQMNALLNTIKIYKPVESQSQLEGNTFKGLLKVCQ